MSDGSSSGRDAFVGLVTVAGDGISGSAVDDTFFVPGHNAGITYIGRTTSNMPVMAVHNTSSNVAVGLENDSPGGRIVAARVILDRKDTVELQGNNATAGAHAVAIGYRGPYNTRDMQEAGFIQVEWQGNSFRPLLLQPHGGSVMIGHGAPAGGFDLNEAVPGVQAHRFHVAQHINTGSAVMADFAFKTSSPDGDSGAGRFTTRQDETSGGSLIRALEAHVIRHAGASSSGTWAMEVGFHSIIPSDRLPHRHVGIMLLSNAGFLNLEPPEEEDPQPTPQKGDSAIAIRGEVGWKRAIWYANEVEVRMFEVDEFGDVYNARDLKVGQDVDAQRHVKTGALGDALIGRDVIAGRHVQTGATGDALIGRDVIAARHVQTGSTGDALIGRDVIAGRDVKAGASGSLLGPHAETTTANFLSSMMTDEAYANAYYTFSSGSQKENIVPLESDEAFALLAQLTPVQYNLIARPGRPMIGFVAEDVPPPLSVEDRAVDVMGILGTLTAVVRAQREAIQQLQTKVGNLES